MAITNFVPEIWSAQILVNLRKALIMGQPGIINRNYEGDIARAGDTVHITAFTQPAVRSYTKDTDITVDVLTDATEALVIDQQKYFAFEVDDVDKRQALPGFIAQSTSDAGYALADVADQYLAGLMAAGVAAGSPGIGNPDGVDNRLGAVTVSTSSPGEAYDVIIDLRTKLTKAKVPSMGRFLVCGPDFYAVLLRDDRFIRVNEAGTDQGLRNGIVGRVAGFDVYESLNDPDTGSADSSSSGGTIDGVSTVIAGHPMATTFAEQIVSTEAYRVEKRFGDGIKGLHVYAGKVVRSAALATAAVTVDAPAAA